MRKTFLFELLLFAALILISASASTQRSRENTEVLVQLKSGSKPLESALNSKGIFKPIKNLFFLAIIFLGKVLYLSDFLLGSFVFICLPFIILAKRGFI